MQGRVRLPGQSDEAFAAAQSAAERAKLDACQADGST